MNLFKYVPCIVLLLISVLLLHDRTGYGLQCFTCSAQRTNTNPNNPNSNPSGGQLVPCEVPLMTTEVPTETCASGDYVCAKYTTRSSTGMETIFRGCRDRNICETIKQQIQNLDYNRLISCATCGKNLCDSNVAYKSIQSPMVLVLVLVPMLQYCVKYVL